MKHLIKPCEMVRKVFKTKYKTPSETQICFHANFQLSMVVWYSVHLFLYIYFFCLEPMLGGDT